jgi:hypothetical protein
VSVQNIFGQTELFLVVEPQQRDVASSDDSDQLLVIREDASGVVVSERALACVLVIRMPRIKLALLGIAG